jgi:hypothetical protein
MGEMGEQALIIYLSDIGRHAEEIELDPLDALLALQGQLAQAIERAGLGEVDGHEIALDDSEGSLYTYGPDAKAMLKAALPVLCPSVLAPGGTIKMRYGAATGASVIEEVFLLADLCARGNS